MNRVAIVKYDQTPNALRQAIELCDGFDKLRPNHKIFVKVGAALGFPGRVDPPNGWVISRVVVEDLVNLLREYRVKDITVGEGSIPIRDIKANTASAFAWAGVDEAAQKLGFHLVDLNKGEYLTLDFEGKPIQVSRLALEAEYFINLTLFRPHINTKVTAGMKNLKGCLSMESKKDFHRSKALERFIALLATKIRSDLIIGDGIYIQQQAPARRIVHEKNLILASKDLLSFDVVASAILGTEPSSVGHLQEYANLTGRSLDLDSIEIKGEKIEEVKFPLPWAWDWPEQFRTRYQATNLWVQDPRETSCSQCLTVVQLALASFLAENRGATFDNVEICFGFGPIARPEAKHLMLVGNCSFEPNGDREKAIKVRGCPPTQRRMLEALRAHAVKVAR